MKNTVLFMLDTDALDIFGPENETGTPERNLLMAVLERAVLDFVGNDQKEVEEAEGWIFSELEEPSYAPFTFSWVCLQLGIDRLKIARKIREMPKRGARRIAPWYFMERHAS